VRIGAHISIASGIPKAIETCKSINANTYQFFTRNPRGGAQRTIPEDEIEEGLKLARKAGVASPVGHLPYTVNMATPRKRAYSFARQVLRDDLTLLDRMRVPYAVVHPGSHVGSGVEVGMRRIVDAVSHALEETESRLLLETMAGQGTEIGSSFEEVAELLDRLGNEERLGVCMDSAHLFGAGYDLKTPDAVRRTLQKADEAFGLHRVKVFLSSIVNNEFVRSLPIILEVPTDTVLDYGPQIAAVLDLLVTV